MKTFGVLATLTLLQACLIACTYKASFNPSPYVNPSTLKPYTSARSEKRPEDIIFIKEPPQKSFIVLGTLDAPVFEWTAHYTTEDLLQAMRVKAAEIGADAILDFRTKHDPTVRSVGSVTIMPGYAVGSMAAVPFKGLHAWGEAILFVPEEIKKQIEGQGK